ncbi:MAG: TylF/MycF/NovP-related O-methyltransferase [Geminicoccales bacterium]
MHDQAGAFGRILEVVGSLLPGERLKTATYLNCIAAPRRFVRKSVGGFYRMDHIYEVCKEFGRFYDGKFSILEFGVADGYSFTKKLYATHYLKMQDRVMVHGFDTFEGLPDNGDRADRALVEGEEWIAGQYRGRYEDLLSYCGSRYSNFRLHKGLFEDTLTDRLLAELEEYRPILIWIDCDYYSSTRQVFERLTPYVPTGCVVYFDDINHNFGSRFTGEMRAVWEINRGAFGHGVELVPDHELSCDTNRVYRFVNLEAKTQHRRLPRSSADPVRHRRDDSPFP